MNTIAILAALTVFRVNPWFNKPFLPDADPEGGVVTDTISFAAAQGEIEAVSFVVNPDADYAKVDVVPSDLTGPDGAKIPASAADVSLVKVWFRPAGRWNTSWKGGQTKPEPINNLVLHDDALVRVDWDEKVNYLRGEYPDGTYYMDISRRDLNTHFDHDCEPVRDAPKFVPFDLKEGFRQQYLVTWKVPKDAKPGDYKGTITLSTPNSQLTTLNLSLEVYPFALPRPRTHYDTREPYVSYWMGSPSLGGLLAHGRRLDRAERKLRAIFRNMAEHNAINLSAVGHLGVDSTDDYALRTLLIARQEGLCADPLINSKAFDITNRFVVVQDGTDKDLREPEAEPERYRKSLDGYRAFVARQRAIMDKYLGHHRCYYQSADECGYETNRRSYGYWSVIHELGGRIWTDYAYAKYNGAFVDMNDVPGSVDHRDAWRWRHSGAKAVTYASTFTGPENPDLWRRIKGLRFWYADFDGQHEYDFFDGRYNRWNDFVYRGSYCMFGIVYWTMDGLVSTLAWEAVRESLDDVRYFTLLRLRAEAALKSSDPKVRRLGRKALTWQDGVDPEYVLDLDAFRRETAEWIKRLVAKVGPQPADADTELPPPAEIPPDSRLQGVPKASAGAKAIFAYAARMAGQEGSRYGHGENRYDLAIPALEALLEDASAKTPDRIRAAMWLSTLHSEIKERPAAVAAVEKALALKDVGSAERGKLCLQRVNVMMTDEKYQEKYTVEHLDKASKALEEALRYAGATEEERYGAVRKMAAGYLSAGEYEKCIAFATARLKDTTLTPQHQAWVQIIVGNAWKGLEEWTKALKAFDEAHRAFNDEKNRAFRRAILLTEAEAAEKAKDYVRAVHCWTDIIPTYDPAEQKDLIQNAKNNVIRLQPLARKNSRISAGTMDEDDEKEVLSLDE